MCCGYRDGPCSLCCFTARGQQTRGNLAWGDICAWKWWMRVGGVGKGISRVHKRLHLHDPHSGRRHMTPRRRHAAPRLPLARPLLGLRASASDENKRRRQGYRHRLGHCLSFPRPWTTSTCRVYRGEAEWHTCGDIHFLIHETVAFYTRSRAPCEGELLKTDPTSLERRIERRLPARRPCYSVEIRGDAWTFSFEKAWPGKNVQQPA